MHGKVYFERTKDSDRPEVFNGAGLIFDSFGHGLQVMTVLRGGLEHRLASKLAM